MAYGTSTTSSGGANLNLRNAGSLSGSIIGKIPDGSQITITGAAVGGWYPVSYGGQTGWVSAQYVNPFTPSTGGGGTPAPDPGTSPAPPPGVPHTQSGSNPYYSPSSTYGSHQNWYDTPLVSGNTNNFGAEYERWITEQGFGGTTQKANLARNLFDRAESGFAAATMNNPGLTNRAYLNQMLGPNFLRNQMARMTPTQRGESRAIYAPPSRWIPRD